MAWAMPPSVMKSKRFINSFQENERMEKHRMVLATIVLGAVVVALFVGKPSITGFVPTETYSQELDIDIFESQRFTLSAGEMLRFSSLGVSGEVNGQGLVNIYLSDGTHHWLVYSNKKKPGSDMEIITGMAVRELNIAPGPKIDRIESLPAGYKTLPGAFKDECVETCVLDDSLFSTSSAYLDIVLEPGTTLHISNIKFSTPGE
jgi:hypothetical protein